MSLLLKFIVTLRLILTIGSHVNMTSGASFLVRVRRHGNMKPCRWCGVWTETKHVHVCTAEKRNDIALYTTSMCENTHCGFFNKLLFIHRFISVICQLCLTIKQDNKIKLNVFLLLYSFMFYRGFNLNQALQQ